MGTFEDSLTLAEKVSYGMNIGIDADTAADYLCLVCLTRKKRFSTLIEADGVRYCPTHNEQRTPCKHKKDVIKYRDRYKQEEQMSKTEERQLTVRPPVLPSKVEKAEMVNSILKAGLVTSDKFGAFTQMAQEYLAVVALIHGLDPLLQEVQVWPNTRWDAKNGEEIVNGIVTFISGYGYLRKAEERERIGDGYTWAEDDGYVLSPEEVRLRRAHICSACNGSGKYGSNNNCKYCKGKGEFDPADVIVVKRSLYLQRQAKVAKEIGIKPRPISGYGVIQPWDYNIARGRDLIARAELRGLKAVLKNAYQISFWIPNADETLLDNYVPGAEMAVEENGDVIEGEARVIEQPEIEPEPEPPVEEPERQEELPGIEQLGFDEAGVDIQGDAMARLTEFGYAKGKPQLNLVQALFGEETNWASITYGQIQNMLMYASLAHGQSKELKDQLKIVVREATKFLTAEDFASI